MNLSSCGHRGKLKTPSQIEAEEQKKARKAGDKEEMNDDSMNDETK